MKNIFLVASIFFVLKTQANDTLTRAQVYNFNVGDTFDYKNDIFGLSGYGVTTNISYTRFLITNMYYSSDSTTKFIVRKQLYPEPIQLDTLIVQNLSEFQIFIDTGDCWVYFYSQTVAIDSSSQYHNRVTNSYTLGCEGDPFLSKEAIVCAEGLGIVMDYYLSSGMPGNYTDDTIELIYYSLCNETWGTPYYNFTTGIQSLSPNSGQISLYPTVNNGTFNAKITGTTFLPVNLILYDITGRVIKQLSLNNQDNNISIAPCSSGIYIWKAIAQGQLIETGKMVVQ